MSSSSAKLYLIPSMLDEDAVASIPGYVVDAIKQCEVFFVENERSARRYLKKIWKDIVIDSYGWHAIDEREKELEAAFRERLDQGRVIGIISEAGLPGVADPGQKLVAIAQEKNVEIRPLVGPNSILLALMASGMNGQQFRFAGYLPVNEGERSRAIKALEADSVATGCTQIFIETPYRNNQVVESVLKGCRPATRFCIAVDLTGKNEWIKTMTVRKWQQQKPDIHKRPAIFLLLAG
jgi:16S rRNA (cytidine1402-2'-O)-methyltransferase